MIDIKLKESVLGYSGSRILLVDVLPDGFTEPFLFGRVRQLGTALRLM